MYWENPGFLIPSLCMCLSKEHCICVTPLDTTGAKVFTTYFPSVNSFGLTKDVCLSIQTTLRV